jgi:hypothetical protein
MSTAYESIMQGLNEALDHAQGKEASARVHTIETSRQSGPRQACRKVRLHAAWVSLRAHCSSGSMAAGNRLARRRCCWQ